MFIIQMDPTAAVGPHSGPAVGRAGSRCGSSTIVAWWEFVVVKHGVYRWLKDGGLKKVGEYGG